MINVHPSEQWSRKEGTGQYKNNTNVLSEIFKKFLDENKSLVNFRWDRNLQMNITEVPKDIIASFNHYSARLKINYRLNFDMRYGLISKSVIFIVSSLIKIFIYFANMVLLKVFNSISPQVIQVSFSMFMYLQTKYWSPKWLCLKCFFKENAEDIKTNFAFVFLLIPKHVHNVCNFRARFQIWSDL